MRKRRRGWPLCTVALFFVLGTIVSAGDRSVAATPPPNGELRVAYRQQEDGKLSDSVHHVTLECVRGECSLTTLTLNRCEAGRFYPGIERVSTSEGNLSVIEIRDGVLEAEARHPQTTMKYRFTYTTISDQEALKRLQRLQLGGKWFRDLTGFSGAVVKQSDILDEVISWKLIPLKGRFPRIEVGCQIMLDGVPED